MSRHLSIYCRPEWLVLVVYSRKPRGTLNVAIFLHLLVGGWPIYAHASWMAQESKILVCLAGYAWPYQEDMQQHWTDVTLSNARLGSTRAPRTAAQIVQIKLTILCVFISYWDKIYWQQLAHYHKNVHFYLLLYIMANFTVQLTYKQRY